MQPGLVYVSGGELALRRERRGGRFVILDPAGGEVTDTETLERVRALRIPPAWSDVWIAAIPNAHLQATGIDARGRRQYLYHPLWRQRREEEKFDDMLEFAERLPAVRARARTLLALERGDRDHTLAPARADRDRTLALAHADRDRTLALAHADRDRTLALAIRLLDVGLFRVGWDRYARDNGHVGLTTLRRDNVTLRDAEVHFDFIAKSGKRRRLTVRDPQSVPVLSALKRRRGVPEELLVYPLGRNWHRIHAADVNNALRCWAGGPYSAKEFRTWAGTALAAVALAREHADGKRGPRAVSRAVRQVSTALGNTPAVARSSYIDPRVITLFEDDVVIELPEGAGPGPGPVLIETDENGVVLELPTDVDGDELRLEVEQRVYELLATGRERSGT